MRFSTLIEIENFLIWNTPVAVEWATMRGAYDRTEAFDLAEFSNSLSCLAVLRERADGDLLSAQVSGGNSEQLRSLVASLRDLGALVGGLAKAIHSKMLALGEARVSEDWLLLKLRQYVEENKGRFVVEAPDLWSGTGTFKWRARGLRGQAHARRQ